MALNSQIVRTKETRYLHHGVPRQTSAINQVLAQGRHRVCGLTNRCSIKVDTLAACIRRVLAYHVAKYPCYQEKEAFRRFV